MKTFIVPVNFSPCSADAARYAVDLAQEMNAEVHLLHVVQIPVASAELSMTEDLYNQVFELVASSLKELQEELRWRANNRVPIHTASLTGSITAGVSELCDKLKPELVVLGVTGKTLEKFLTGSPVNAMLHLRQPILVVPEHAVFHPYRQIALACDETDINRGVPHSIPLIKELAERFQAKVDIVNVETSEVMTNEAFGYELGETRTLSEIHPSRHYIRRPSVLEGLEAWLKDCPSDLAVVFPKKHSLFEFHASKSRAIARHCSIPILSLPE